MLKKLFTAGFGAFLSLNAFAYSDDPFAGEIPLIWTPIITLSGGPAWTDPGQLDYLYPSFPGIQVNQYIPNDADGTIATGEIFFGLQRIVYPRITGELGLGIAGATDIETDGTVTVNGIPNVGTYQYSIEHGRLDLKGRLIFNPYRLQPYVSGSIGVALNESHDFRALTVNPLFWPAPWFGNQANPAFTYTLGAGAQYYLNRNWIFGVGYEFASWGTSRLGLDGLTNIQGPNLTTVYTNELLFSISYMFN